jgi:transcriptional regulator with XRE-family HTH domain
MPDNQMQNVSERLKIARESFSLGQVEFAKRAKLFQSQISGVEKEKKNITNNILIKLEDTYGISRKWLEHGEGEMLLPGSSTPNVRMEATPLRLASDPNDYDNDGTRFEELPDGTIRMRVPIIPHKAYAGYLRGFQDTEFYEDLSTISIDVFKQHKGHYLAFEVKGDSMTTLEPNHFRESIFDGSIVVGRELPKHKWRYKLHTHTYDAWVIVHKTEGILIKQIIEHDVEKGYITIHSLNPDKEEFSDEELFLDDIEQIFNIVQIINRR